ncbi:hypothetical protein [Streptomyces herbicida]|uniref:hypothetical protein n=1 Tax=Streptomyces herbicida TaxID=3065675 RepID=UPI00292DA535|nr:hypothetical protein [Streptomyces sp. NEAU-HV9]
MPHSNRPTPGLGVAGRERGDGTHTVSGGAPLRTAKEHTTGADAKGGRAGVTG